MGVWARESARLALRARAGAYCAAPGRRAAKLRAALDARSPTFLRPGVHAPSRCAGDVECGREAWFIEGRAFFDTAAHSMRPRCRAPSSTAAPGPRGPLIGMFLMLGVCVSNMFEMFKGTRTFHQVRHPRALIPILKFRLQCPITLSLRWAELSLHSRR